MKALTKTPAEVSVICVTYNQKAYLRKALDSMLAQKTTFSYEIIVHDDVSTDGTADIIKEYEAAHPGKVKAIFERENQYSQGVDFFADMVRETAGGKYIAVCEGDDFWLDEYKLQFQRDALETHPACDMCACRGCTVTEDGEREVSQIRPMTGDGVLTPEEVIMGGGQYLVSAGLFFRKEMYDKMLPFEKVIPLDYAMQIKGSLRGGIYYIDKKMAVYRRYANGSWTNKVLRDQKRLEEQWNKERNLLETLDLDTGGKYHETIRERLKAYTSFDQQLDGRKDEIKRLVQKFNGKRFIWGMGRRGESLERFCRQENIPVDGVCDIRNTAVGERTVCGNRIVSTDEVLMEGNTIFASTQWAYTDLANMDFKGEILNFQEYMPLG